MHRALLIVCCAGCAFETSPAGTATSDSTLGQNTYYTGIVPPYATPEACEASASNPIACHLELGFCADGTAGFSNFDEPEQGDYHLEGAIIVATFDSGVLRLDPTTGHATNAEVETYILDTVGRWNTLQFDSGIVCPLP